MLSPSELCSPARSPRADGGPSPVQPGLQLGQPGSSVGEDNVPSDNEDFKHLLVVTPDKPLFSLTPSPKKAPGYPDKEDQQVNKNKPVDPAASAPSSLYSGTKLVPAATETVAYTEEPAAAPKSWKEQMLAAAEAEELEEEKIKYVAAANTPDCTVSMEYRTPMMCAEFQSCWASVIRRHRLREVKDCRWPPRAKQHSQTLVR